MANDSPPPHDMNQTGPKDAFPRHGRIRRDRHGRGLRGLAMHPQHPQHRTRAAAFNAEVLTAIAAIEVRLPEELASISFAIEDAPTHRDLALRSNEQLLGRIERGNPSLCVLYRLPIMMQSLDDQDRKSIIRRVLAQLLSDLTQLRPSTIDPQFKNY